MKRTKLKSMLSSVFVVLILVGAFGALGTLAVYYDRFAEVFTVHGRTARADLPEPYNLPLLESTNIDLAGRELGLIWYEKEALLRLRGFWLYEALPEDRVFIAYSTSPVAFRVDMPGYIKSFGRMWQGESVEVTTTGALEGTFAGDPGHRSRTWGVTVPKGLKQATPSFDVTIPIEQVDMEQPINDRAIEVNTVFKVSYPGSSGSVGFSNRSETLEHHCWLIPLSQSEIDEYKAVRRDYRLSKGLPTCLTGLGVALLIAVVLIVGPILIGRRFGIQ